MVELLPQATLEEALSIAPVAEQKAHLKVFMHKVTLLVYAHVAVDEVQKPVQRAVAAAKVLFQVIHQARKFVQASAPGGAKGDLETPVQDPSLRIEFEGRPQGDTILN